MRRHAQRLVDTLLAWKCRPIEPVALEGAALVFSPHYDDEALGLGGTIIRRADRGAQTRVVFMTDGAGSHRHLMPAEALTRTRKAEAVAANARAGLDEKDLVHMGFPDGALSLHYEEAVNGAAEILDGSRPDVLFAPYMGDSPADHRATTAIVRAAMRRSGIAAPLFQYPVWFWHHWPRVGLEAGSRRHLPRALWRTFADNVRLLGDFECYVDVRDVLERKRAYLSEYRSQTTRLIDDARWMTLADIAGGDFLRSFFTPREYFARKG